MTAKLQANIKEILIESEQIQEYEILNEKSFFEFLYRIENVIFYLKFIAPFYLEEQFFKFWKNF